MTKRFIIAFSLLFGFKIFGITHEECEALKSDINSRLDTIDDTVSFSLSYIADIDDIILNTYTARFSNTDPANPGTYQSTCSTYYYDSSGNPLGTLDDIHIKLNSVRSDFQVITNNTAYIRSLLLSVNCDDAVSTNGCNCAEQLSTISEQVDSIFGTLSLQYGILQEINLFLDYFYSDFSTYSQDVLGNLSSISNSLFSWNNSRVSSTDFQNLIYSGSRFKTTQTGNNAFRSISTSALGPFRNVSYFQSGTFSDIVRYGFLNSVASLISLNNYSYTNLYLSSSIHQQAFSINTNLVSANVKLSSISNSFSIFNDFVFSSEAPLSMYTDSETDGSYHDYLTNYYINVSKGRHSGSDNFTNWFSRIEILLASLVFQDDGTNFVDEAENTTQMENTLSQSVDTLSQAVSLPEGVTGKIDNMGQSFLGLLEEWRTIVSGNSLPSQFVLCDINLGSQSRDSSSGSSVSSFRLETSLDSGQFRQFLDFCHAVTTILFTMLFLWLSIILLSFLLASLAKLVHFCYVVYSALFGG